MRLSEGQGTKVQTVKKWFFIGIGFGAGAALMVGVLVAGVAWYSSRERPWDTKAIKATYQHADTSDADRHIYFVYSIENTTDKDYSLSDSDSLSLMVSLEKQKSLLESTKELSLNLPLFVPAKQRVLCTLNLNSYKYPPVDPPDGFIMDRPDNSSKYWAEVDKHVREKLPNFAGFTAFDRGNRYQINFPQPK